MTTMTSSSWRTSSADGAIITPFGLCSATMLQPYRALGLTSLSVLPHKLPGTLRLRNRIVLGQFDIIQKVRRHQLMGHPDSHIPFRIDDPIDANPLQYAPVQLGHGFGNDFSDPKLLHLDTDENARLQIIPDRDNGAIEIPDAERTKDILIRRIGNDGVRQDVVHLRDNLFILIDPQHLMAEARPGSCARLEPNLPIPTTANCCNSMFVLLLRPLLFFYW